MRKILIILAVTIPVAALLCAALIIIFLTTADLRNAAEKYAGRVLNRNVTIGVLDITWADPILITIKDFHLANADWGTEPEMGSFTELNATIHAWPLLHGKTVLEKLSVTDPKLFLERDSDGIGNWRFRQKEKSQAPTNPFHTIAKDRAHFPAILDGQLKRGLFRMKTSSGAIIRIDANTLSIMAEAEDQTVKITIDGAYNKVPAKFQFLGDSYNLLRQPRQPYGATITIDTKSDRLRFNGTMTDPTDADGAKGDLVIDAAVLGEIAPMLGVTMPINMGAKAAGQLTRAGDDWVLENIKGHLAGSAMSGKVALHEGSRAEPDVVAADLAFGHVDAQKIINGIVRSGKTKTSDFGTMTMQPDSRPGVIAEAHVTAREIFYEPYHVTDVVMKLRSEASRITLDTLDFTIIGGRAHMEALLDGTGKTPHWHSEASIKNAEISRSVRLRGKYAGLISGAFEARSILDMHGKTVATALQNSSGGVVVVMNKGEIARSLLEKASMDLRALLRTGKGRVPITCLIGVYNLHNGSGDVLPLRLRTTETVLDGGGHVDLANGLVDATVRARPSTSSKYSLDWPIRFSGDFSGIDLLPAPGMRTEILNQPIASLMPGNLNPHLRALADKSACLQ